MWWMTWALAGGAETANAKLQQALDACGDDLPCRDQAVELWSAKAAKKGWTLAAAEPERARQAHAQWLEAGQGAFEGMQEQVDSLDLSGALDALDAWEATYAGHPLTALLERRRQELVERATFAPEAPWTATVVQPVAVEGPKRTLKKLDEKRNQITDTATWFTSNELTLPAFGPSGTWFPGIEPTALRLGPLGTPDLVVTTGDTPVALWTKPLQAALLDGQGRPTRIFALGGLGRAPGVKPGDEAYVEQELNWAVADGDVLYVSTFHRTYAASSLGHNAYVTAFDAKTGELRWRSEPLVSNAANFVLLPTQIVAGYGFTAEPDFVVVLDRATGAVQQRIKVPSGPEVFALVGERLYVRTYDRDLVFSVK